MALRDYPNTNTQKAALNKPQPQSEDSDFDVIVPEPRLYPWPTEVLPLQSKCYGVSQHNTLLFNMVIRLAKKLRQDFHWVVFYNSPGQSSTNIISEYPQLIEQMERLFNDELGTKYSEPQEHLLRSAHSVIVAVDKNNGSLAAYSCNSYLPKRTEPGIPVAVSFGCHEIIAEKYQRARLGSLLGALICVYGHSPFNIFRSFAVATRTNNKYIYSTLSAFGDIYRSDHLTNKGTRPEVARSIVRYMQNTIFDLVEEVPLDHPITIQHQFDDGVTLAGLSNQEIIYAVSFSTLYKAFTRLLKKPKRIPKN